MLYYKLLLGVSVPVCLVLSLLIMVGNALVLRLLLRNGQRDAITMLMISLVVSDVAIGLVSFPMAMLFNAQVVLPFQACVWLTCTSLCWIIVSSLHHLAIAVDRWYRVSSPARYLTSATRIRALMHIIACWTLAICFAYVPVFGYNNQELLRQAAANGSGVTWLTPRGQLHVICQNLVVLNLDYLVYVLFVVCTLLPVLATTALYLLMLLRVGSGHQARVAATAHVAEGLHERKQRRLTANMLLALLAYVLLKIPYNALNCVFLYCPTCQVPYWAVPFTFSLILCSAVFNPFIVFLTHKQARDWCCRAAGCRRRWKRETVVSLVRVAERSVKT